MGSYPTGGRRRRRPRQLSLAERIRMDSDDLLLAALEIFRKDRRQTGMTYAGGTEYLAALEAEARRRGLED